MARARAGDGPTLIEAQTYRYHGHFGADDPLGYRTQEEEDYYEARDCIEQLKGHILDGEFASETDLNAIDEKCAAAVVEAARFANDSPFPDDVELMSDVYVSYP